MQTTRKSKTLIFAGAWRNSGHVHVTVKPPSSGHDRLPCDCQDDCHGCQYTASLESQEEIERASRNEFR
jgi:hypothetical protein